MTPNLYPRTPRECLIEMKEVYEGVKEKAEKHLEGGGELDQTTLDLLSYQESIVSNFEQMLDN